jgi:hypothetical protein
MFWGPAATATAPAALRSWGREEQRMTQTGWQRRTRFARLDHMSVVYAARRPTRCRICRQI